MGKLKAAMMSAEQRLIDDGFDLYNLNSKDRNDLLIDEMTKAEAEWEQKREEEYNEDQQQ
jgi:hypothetical protein